MDEQTVVIEKNIPIPTREYDKKRPINNKYGFLLKMEVGDSVELNLLHTKGVKNTRSHKGFTYYGLMNAIHKTQKDSTTTTRNINTPYVNHSAISLRPVKKSRKYSTRTIRVEGSNNSDTVNRIVRVWRLK